MEREPVQNIGSNYVIHEVLGRGAIGDVWRGTTRDGAPIAVKVLRPEYGQKRDVVRRFIQERELLMHIDHPNVVRVHDLVYELSTLAIVMDLVEDGDLAGMMAREGPLSSERIRSIAGDIALGLAAVHAADIVHLDMKPGNVLLRGTGDAVTALIADLGVSQLVKGPTGVTEHPRFGTPQYTAPEIVTGGDVGSAADIYALGLLMVEMRLGRPAIGAESDPLGILEAQVSHDVVRPGGLDDELWSLISEMLAKSPEARPTALEVATALGKSPEQLSVSALPDAPQAGADGGQDRPLFQAMTAEEVYRESEKLSADPSLDGPATTELGHRTSFLRSAQTVELRADGPRTMALPPRKGPGGSSDTDNSTGAVEDRARPAAELTEHADGAEAEHPGGMEAEQPGGGARRWRTILVSAGAAAAATALLVIVVLQIPSFAPPEPSESPSATASPSPTETDTSPASVPPDAVTVPSVIGMTEQAARQQIHGGLRVKTVGVPGTAQNDGTVTGTIPEEGTPVSPGDTVTLQVARETASHPLTDLNPVPSAGTAEIGTVSVGGSAAPNSLLLDGPDGSGAATIALQKRYMTLETGVAVPDDGAPTRVAISLDQVPSFEQTIQPGENIPLTLDITGVQNLTIRVTAPGDNASAALTDATVSGEKGRVPGS